MYFDDFISKLKVMLQTKQTFHTLKRDIEFDAVFGLDGVTITSPTITVPRVIPMRDFYNVWMKANEIPKEKRYNTSNYDKITLNSSYVVKLIELILKENEIEKLSH